MSLAEWQHCPGELNPADLSSRGLDLNSHERPQKWLHGPDFLSKDEEIWPQIPLSGKEVVELPTDNELVEPKHWFVTCLQCRSHSSYRLNRYSHVTKLFRVTRYVLRFVKNLKRLVHRKRPENCFTFWQRMVQTTKRCLRKILVKEKLNYEELLTVVREIEAVVNSRQLCCIYDNDSMDDVITPSHMMLGRRLSIVPDSVYPENVDFSPESISKRCKHINNLLTKFWNRWNREYLTELREFHNCRNRLPSRQISVGEVVLIGDEKLPRNRWRMGIVTELVCGKDNLPGCNLRTISKQQRISYLSRPINKLYLLEIKSREISDPGNSSDVYLTVNEKFSSIKQDVSNISVDRPVTSRPRLLAAEKGVVKRILENQQ